jgi:hypothetical protein
MTPKPILAPTRVRRPPPTGWSWVDRRFIREHMAYLWREAVLLYFFLSTVADKHGLSFYGDGTLAIQLQMTLSILVEARDELLACDLIAHETRFTQVLSLPLPHQLSVAVGEGTTLAARWVPSCYRWFAADRHQAARLGIQAE